MIDKVFLLDMDGVVFAEGTDDFLPGAREGVERLVDGGWTICCFTCRPMGPWPIPWLEKMAEIVPKERLGYLHKPYAGEYGIADDKLTVAARDLNREIVSGPQTWIKRGGKTTHDDFRSDHEGSE